jgi:2-(1,2-epoxy-1,2-dihydrophenyl)acetyl-CoA isomerase
MNEAVTPERALDLGLANEVVPAAEFDDRLAELAADIADGPTSALGSTMRLLTESYDRNLEAQLAVETDTIADATHSEDYERGFAAFFDKDDPDFTGQ